MAAVLWAVAALGAEPQAAQELRRLPAVEARQGVAVDAGRVYAVDNSAIGQYDKRTGARLGEWRGDPALFPHLNSCQRVGAELVCAASNYPSVPQASSVEFFDADTLEHRRSHSLGPGIGGSLTAITWRDGSWWAVLANYDARGGEPGRDHRATLLARLDADFQREAAWLFPDAVLERIAPRSVSGMAWDDDGRLYVTGHDRPELYVLALPEAGATLRLLAVVAIPTPGQAIDLEPAATGARLWSIDRPRREIVVSRLPEGVRPDR